jgi:hypothetical protein
MATPRIRPIASLAATLALAAALLSTAAEARCYVCSHRSSSAKHEFMRQTGYPHGRPGYVVDHIRALKRGGADAPSNMQWQTRAEARAKDKWE